MSARGAEEEQLLDGGLLTAGLEFCVGEDVGRDAAREMVDIRWSRSSYPRLLSSPRQRSSDCFSHPLHAPPKETAASEVRKAARYTGIAASTAEVWLVSPSYRPTSQQPTNGPSQALP